MIGISKQVPWHLEHSVEDDNGRYVMLRGFLYQIRLTFVVIYALNVNQLSFWEELSSLLGSYQGELILCGDFNIVVDTFIDRSSSTRTPGASAQFLNFMRELKLKDIWRERNPKLRNCMYYSAQHQSFSRIYMICETEGFYSQVKEINIKERLSSDHAPVVMKWECAMGQPHQFYWRLNNWLLEAKGLKEDMVGKIIFFL